MTTPIPAEGRAGTARIKKTPIPAEGRGQIRNRKKKTEFLHLDHAGPAGRSEIAKKTLSFCASTTPIPAEGRKTRSTIKVLPRRPRQLNLTYIAANAEAMHLALCTWLYMRLALCTWLYALGSMHSGLCTALRTWLHALGSMRLALCTGLYALGSMHGSMHLALCTWLYALGSMHLAPLAPCAWLYVFDSAQVALCKLVRERRAEEHFAMLSRKSSFPHLSSEFCQQSF